MLENSAAEVWRSTPEENENCSRTRNTLPDRRLLLPASTERADLQQFTSDNSGMERIHAARENSAKTYTDSFSSTRTARSH